MMPAKETAPALLTPTLSHPHQSPACTTKATKSDYQHSIPSTLNLSMLKIKSFAEGYSLDCNSLYSSAPQSHSIELSKQEPAAFGEIGGAAPP